mgnify:CR=1 FL=1
MSHITPVESIPVHKLNIGDVFVKVRNGLPCITILKYVGTLGGTAHAETYNGTVKTMSGNQLVHQL